MWQNIADFSYFNFLGRTSQKKHPVGIMEVKSHSLGNYNLHSYEQKVHDDEEQDCQEEIMILMTRRPSWEHQNRLWAKQGNKSRIMFEQKHCKGESPSRTPGILSPCWGFPVDRAGRSGLQLQERFIHDAEMMPLVYGVQIRILRHLQAWKWEIWFTAR